jgi:FtsZ-interacting cell division protein YlmF
MGLFHKEEENKDTYVSAKDRIIMEQLKDDDNRASKLVDLEKNGNPLILNFKKLDIMACNKLLAFFAGATYAIGGKTIKVNETTYLFARQEDFQDGSLNEFLESI